jgi:hypothetical protein
MELRFLARPLAQLIQFHAQAMSQRAFRPEFVEQLLGLAQCLVGALYAAKQTSPRTRYLLFSKQSNTSSI